MNKTVCIIGLRKGQDTEEWTREPKGVELWTVNQAHAIFSPGATSRITRLFQIHSWSTMAARQNPAVKHLEWMSQATIPIYLEEVQEGVPTGVRYPFEDVAKTIGSNYFATNSFCYMVALAIHEGFKEIHFYGIDMGPTDWSDGYARPHMEFLLGIAHARDIAIQVFGESSLLKGYLYGKTLPMSSAAVEIALDALKDAQARLQAAINLIQPYYNRAFKDEAHHKGSNLVQFDSDHSDGQLAIPNPPWEQVIR
jgi:hypothetical protein